MFVSFLLPCNRKFQRHPAAFFPLTGHEIHYIIFIPDKPIYLLPPPSKTAHVIAVTYKKQRFIFPYLAEKVCSICLLCASGNLQRVLWGFVVVVGFFCLVSLVWLGFFNEVKKEEKV